MKFKENDEVEPNKSVIKQATYDYLDKNISQLKVDVLKGEIEGRPIYEDRHGYLTVGMKGRAVRYHHVIGYYIFGERMVGRQINHINGNKKDNRAVNLEVSTPSENAKHALDTGLREVKKGEELRWSKLTDNDVYEIRRLYKEGYTQKRLADIYGVCFQQISRIVNRERWAHLPEKKDHKITSMLFDEYQRAASRTAVKEANEDLEMCNYAMGASAEIGEAVDLLKKKIFHGHPFSKDELEKELGDCLWYISQLARVNGLSLEKIAITNIEKLKKRFPNGFNTEDSIKRVDANE